MAADDETTEPESSGDEGDYVPAFFARDMEEAGEYCELLADHDIPARAGIEDELTAEDSEHRTAGRRGMTHGVPVLVPETLLDEASEIIADREDFANFEEDDIAEEDADDEEFGLAPAEPGADEEDEDDEDDEDEEDFLDDDDDEDESLFGDDDLSGEDEDDGDEYL